MWIVLWIIPEAYVSVDCKMNICGLCAYYLWIVYLLGVDYV